MIRLGLGLAILILSSAAACSDAQTSPASSPLPGATSPAKLQIFASNAEIEAMIAKAKATIKPDQAILVQPLLQFAPYRASLEYRQAGAGAAVHQDDAEFFFVLKGGGNLIEGGELVEPAPADGRNMSAKAIIDGTRRHVRAGDVVVVPQSTPHQFDSVEGVLIMIAMKLPMTGSMSPH